MNIAKIMTPKFNTACLQESSTVRQGLELMKSRGYTAIPVLDKESLHSLFLQIDHYLLRPNSANLLKNTSQLNLK